MCFKRVLLVFKKCLKPLAKVDVTKSSYKTDSRVDISLKNDNATGRAAESS